MSSLEKTCLAHDRWLCYKKWLPCKCLFTGFTAAMYIKLFALERAGMCERTLNWMLGSRVDKPYDMINGCHVHNNIHDARQPGV